MKFQLRCINFCLRSFAALVLFCGAAQAQNVILHLRNGDRIAGTIVSENTNTVTLSTDWIKELVVPVAKIERREIVAHAASSQSALAASTNAASTNASATNLLAHARFGRPLLSTNSWWSRWKGEASVGADVERGQTDHQLYYGKANLTYAQPYADDPKQFFKNIVNYDAAYGRADGVLSDNRMGGSVKSDFDLTRQYYVYNLGAAFYDELREIDLHYEDGPGAGYHWIKLTNFTANLELGGNYQVEDRSDNTRTENFYTRFGQDISWKLNKQMTLTEKAEYFVPTDYLSQFRFRLESTLSYALIYNFNLNFSVVDVYDTQPAATVPNNDIQLRTSLGVKF